MNYDKGLFFVAFLVLVSYLTACNVFSESCPTSNTEAVYFTEQNGTRCAIMVVNVETPSQVPSFAEPWFLSFNADCEFRIVMSPQDLKEAGLEELGRKWS